AMLRGDLSRFDAVETSVLAGRMLLWIAWDGARIKAAAVTELNGLNDRRICTIVACGAPSRKDRRERPDASGRWRPSSCARRGQWLSLRSGLEAYAAAEGCGAMRVLGRRGWAKLLPDYKVNQVILEKEIP